MAPEPYGIDVELPVVDTGVRRDDHAAAVEASVPDRYLQEPFVLDGLVVAVGEDEAGGERFVAQERLDRGHRVGERPDVLFDPRRQSLRRPHAEAHGGDVDVVIVAGEPEVHVDDLAVGYRLAGAVHVRRYLKRAREVVRRAEGQ